MTGSVTSRREGTGFADLHLLDDLLIFKKKKKEKKKKEEGEEVEEVEVEERRKKKEKEKEEEKEKEKSKNARQEVNKSVPSAPITCGPWRPGCRPARRSS